MNPPVLLDHHQIILDKPPSSIGALKGLSARAAPDAGTRYVQGTRYRYKGTLADRECRLAMGRSAKYVSDKDIDMKCHSGLLTYVLPAQQGGQSWCSERLLQD